MPTDLRTVDDQRLVAYAASRIGVPRALVADNLGSFVLHAPLELMARAALLPVVAPSAREAARERIIVLAEGYDAAGPPIDPPGALDFESVDAALDAVLDPGGSDAAATWLGARLTVDELVAALAPTIVARLGAAGHASIFLSLLARYQPRGVPGQMLRHPVHALVSSTEANIDVLPPEGELPVIDVLDALEPIGPPPSPFIAPMVLHSQSAGVFTNLNGPAPRPFELLRYAAHSMLQGSPEHAPYGWTHQLTLAQAPLLLAGKGLDPSMATFVAAAYLAAHWAAYGEGRVDLADAPAPVDLAVAEALAAGPDVAAAAAFHAGAGPSAGEVAGILATMASRSHDAHRVKYTLACLDAASLDPTAQPLYLAAAASLNGWWIERGDDSDPRPDLV